MRACAVFRPTETESFLAGNHRGFFVREIVNRRFYSLSPPPLAFVCFQSKESENRSYSYVSKRARSRLADLIGYALRSRLRRVLFEAGSLTAVLFGGLVPLEMVGWGIAREQG